MDLRELAPFIVKKTIEHLELTIFSVLLAILVAVPIGIFLAEWKKSKINTFIIRSVLVIQTIPALAFMGLIIALLILIQSIIKIPITGIFPGVIVLFIYAFLPILNNTILGIKQISPKQIEVAKDLKMTKRQIFQIKIQLALPLLLKGIRTSTVLTVSMATLVGLIGSGGLGNLIVQGLRSSHLELILAGALPAAFLGISLDWVIVAITKWVISTSKIKFM